MELLKSKFKTLLIPYIIFCCLGILYQLIVHTLWHDLTIEMIGKYFISVIWARYSLKYFTSFNTPMWFVPCLLLTQIMLYLIIKYTDNNKKIVLPIVGTIVFFGWITESNLVSIDFSLLPFNFSSACFALGFLVFGYYYLSEIKDLINRYKENPYKLAFISILLMAITSILAIYNGHVSMGSRVLKNGFIFYITGILGTISLYIISNLINSKVLRFFGTNSFTIMGSHVVVWYGLEFMISTINVIIRNKFNTSFSIQIFPNNATLYSLSIFILTLLFTSLFVFFYNEIKRKFNLPL